MSKMKVIKENLRSHKKEAQDYESDKFEIYNDWEQNRIKSNLDRVEETLETNGFTKRALDVGCGTGNMLRKLSPRFDNVLGIDLSQEMLSRAREKCAVDNGNGNGKMNLIRGQASDLPFPDDSFDIVTSYSVFHHLPNFSDPISEISRILKEGGIFYIDHEPIKRENKWVKFYLKFCDVLNDGLSSGLPPYSGEDGIDREYCDFHIHNGDDAGLPTSKIVDLFEENEFEIIENKSYLSYGSKKKNLLHPVLKSFLSNEWLIMGKKS